MNRTSCKDLIAAASQIIYDGFTDYNKAFHKITRRAQTRFEKCDWKGHQQDIADRVYLYEKATRRVVRLLHSALGSRVKDQLLWHDIRACFGERLVRVPDSGFIKTFFNSVTRRIFRTVGVNPELEFATSGLEEGTEMLKSLSLRRYPFWGSLQKVSQAILEDFHFRVPYADLPGNVSVISNKIRTFIREHPHKKIDNILRFEFINTFFYQSARAYIIGRIIMRDDIQPIVIALKNTGGSITVDTVLMDDEEISIVFSYTRSYYFADPNSVIGAVHFIHSILPAKPIDELYTVLGRLRQGKTERYHAFTRHLEKSRDKFTHAEGDRGLVMLVFTLPSYNLVFKVMRDKFGFPKTITHQGVADKYKLVSRHDRAGRLIDTQEFKNLTLPAGRFSGILLEELLCDASETVKVVKDEVLFSRIYVERRVRPLNLYIRNTDPVQAKHVIIDYGQCIKDLAQTNIFPGDLLLKNFGVTRHRRVIFYDYDEVALITECNFRDFPNAGDDLDELRSEPWFYVGTHDVFPQEFIRFLPLDDELRALFLKIHGDLLQTSYWCNIKASHLEGEASIVVPYYRPS